MSITVKKASVEDICDVIEFLNKCFVHAWSDENVFSELINEKCTYFSMYDDDKLIAFGGYQDIVGQGHITTMGVDKAYRGNQYGNMLLEIIIKYALKKGIKEITLEVRESNIIAINLYEKFGFKIYGKRKNYYVDNNEDAYIMWRFEDKIGRENE